MTFRIGRFRLYAELGEHKEGEACALCDSGKLKNRWSFEWFRVTHWGWHTFLDRVADCPECGADLCNGCIGFSWTKSHWEALIRRKGL